MQRPPLRSATPAWSCLYLTLELPGRTRHGSNNCAEELHLGIWQQQTAATSNVFMILPLLCIGTLRVVPLNQINYYSHLSSRTVLPDSLQTISLLPSPEDCNHPILEGSAAEAAACKPDIHADRKAHSPCVSVCLRVSPRVSVRFRVFFNEFRIFNVGSCTLPPGSAG